jgi:hypothetical protein
MAKTISPLRPPRASCMTRFTWRGGALAASGLLLAALLAGCASEPPKPKPAALLQPPAGKLSEKARQEQRQAILKIRTQTLNQLYKLKPFARTEIEQGAGYGVFEINGLNAVLAGNHGRGVVLENNGTATYMQLARTDIGPGITVKPYWQVLVFRDPRQLSLFVASKLPADVSSDASITVYQLNEKGVSTQADWGARYFRSPDLN